MLKLEDIINLYDWTVMPKSREDARYLPPRVQAELAVCMCELAGRIMTLKKECGMGPYDRFESEDSDE